MYTCSLNIYMAWGYKVGVASIVQHTMPHSAHMDGLLHCSCWLAACLPCYSLWQSFTGSSRCLVSISEPDPLLLVVVVDVQYAYIIP